MSECREIIPEIIWLPGQEVESVKYECFAEFVSFRGHKCKIRDINYILSYKCSAAIGLFWDIVLLVASNPVNNLHYGNDIPLLLRITINSLNLQ